MKKLKILLVDDDEDDRGFIFEALESLNMNTELYQVENGKACLEFLERADRSYPHLIFLDLNMPIMNGLQCLDSIRKDKNAKNIFVAIYSTSSAEKDIEDTFTKGANIYINKPSDFSDIKAALKEVIKTYWADHTKDFNRMNFLLKI